MKIIEHYSGSGKIMNGKIINLPGAAYSTGKKFIGGEPINSATN